MQIAYPVQVQWTLNEDHFLVKAWLSMSEEEQQYLLDTLIDEMVQKCNHGGSFAMFTIDRIKGDN